MSKISILLAALLCATPLAGAVIPPEAADADSDGGRSISALVEDGNGGTWREFPASDAGIAAFTSALEGRSIDAVAYGQELKGAGVYLHSWTGDDGTPFVTAGAYVVTVGEGKLRLPVAIVENVTDMQELALLASDIVGDEAFPLGAEAMPHVYGLTAPDVLIGSLLQGVGLVFVGQLAISALDTVESLDNSNTLANVPPEAYPAAEKLGYSTWQMGYPLIYGQFGLGGAYNENIPENFTYDWSDRPEVRIWLAHKSAAGHDVWSGVAISRTGAATGDAVSDWSAWKRISVGPVARIDGAITAPAAAYVRADVSRHYEDAGPTGGPSSIENHYVFTAGVAAAGTDTPLAQVHMDETRDDSGDEGDETFTNVEGNEGDRVGVGAGEATFLPESQQEDWSAGPVVAGGYVPLVGARTTSAHRGHADEDNLGNANFEWESTRTTSAGVYVLGEYTPLVGAREWTERVTLDVFAILLATEGIGSQDVGDAEASVGVFVQGVYTPLAGSRYDDDFEHHLHAYRGMASAGAYVNGAYSPLIGTTYDGDLTARDWAVAHADRGSGDTAWQTSAGTYTLGFYRPIVGARFVPATHDGAFSAQSSYQIGIYPLFYDPFIPVVSVDHAGERGAGDWAAKLVNGQLGIQEREGDWHADLVAYTPGPFAFPLAGARYTTDAPDGDRAYEMHALVGVWGPNGFVPLVGASYAGDDSPVEVGSGIALAAIPGAAHSEAVISLGVYDPTTGEFVQLAAIDTVDSPR